jgi:hypothetical protein
MYKLFILNLFVYSSFIACKNQSNSANPVAQEKIELPKTPEDVVRAWEILIDKNQFNMARLISMGPTLDLVNSLAETDSLERPSETHTQIINIRCSEKNNEAICNCLLKDDVGSFSYKYYLVRHNGQWFLNNVLPENKKTSANVDYPTDWDSSSN